VVALARPALLLETLQNSARPARRRNAPLADVSVTSGAARTDIPLDWEETGSPNVTFQCVKRVFDVALSLLLLPLLAVFALALLVLNPILNPGPLGFVQKCMGRRCSAFPAFKFRTMREVEAVSRTANCPLEIDRITPLGGLLRKTRIDELPQIINVLRGEMSLIGRRPDYFDHAVHFLNEVPGYRERHAERPGISGLAQTEVGYVEGVEATR
jgi:lipopolysaccharide/colanic/teichoic acid biosynthesis glycosyltransferase